MLDEQGFSLKVEEVVEVLKKQIKVVSGITHSLTRYIYEPLKFRYCFNGRPGIHTIAPSQITFANILEHEVRRSLLAVSSDKVPVILQEWQWLLQSWETRTAPPQHQCSNNNFQPLIYSGQ
jgi:hypothetical protein